MKRHTYLIIYSALVAICCLCGCKQSDTTTPFVVQTTASACLYEGLPMQIGLAGQAGPIAEAVIAKDGTASFSVDLSSYFGKQIWLCVPQVVKAFHTLTADELEVHRLIMPDKDGGSTLLSDGRTNDWIIALYMGVNKDGAADSPIYWATGNLIATKTNDANAGQTEAVFHIASAQETIAEGTAGSAYVAMDDRLVGQVADSYFALPAGSQWDLYSFGDATGLMLYSDINQYVNDSKQRVGDKIVYNISGDASFDISRAQLGGSWRTPTGGQEPSSEYAAFEDNSEGFESIKPDGSAWEVDGKAIGRQYQHTVVIDGKTITTNTLHIPFAGYRHGATFAGGRGGSCWYWSATAEPTAMTPYVPQGEYTGPVDEATTAYNYGYLKEEAKWFPHPRMSGQAIRPVTE